VGVAEIWVEGLWLRYRTKRPLRTLQKLAARGYAAYLRWRHGWVRILPEDVARLARGEGVTVPYFLEHPTFQGCRAHSLVALAPEDLA